MSVHTVLLAALATAAVLCALGGAQAEYTADAALSALRYARAAHCHANEIREWNCHACKLNPSFREVRVVEKGKLGTQAYVLLFEDRIVVGFRGSDNAKNWLSNAKFGRRDYSNCKGCGVHSGFFDSYNSLKKEILHNVQDYLNFYKINSILITGHSLGGALATLAAADIAKLTNPPGAMPHIDLYTYGSPRVGNQKFANWFASTFCYGGHSSYRVTHKKDEVTHLPPHTLGFRHVSREYWYNNDENSDWIECYDVSEGDCSKKGVTEDKKCIFQFLKGEVGDHLLYLGTCTGCSCGSDMLDSMQDVELSARLKLILAADVAYKRSQQRFLNRTY